MIVIPSLHFLRTVRLLSSHVHLSVKVLHLYFVRLMITLKLEHLEVRFILIYSYLDAIINLLHQDGDSVMKKPKVDPDTGAEVSAESDMVEDKAMDVDLPSGPTYMGSDAMASNTDSTTRFGGSGANQLPKEMHEMTIVDEKTHDQSDKVHIVFVFQYMPCISMIMLYYHLFLLSKWMCMVTACAGC